MLRSPLVVMVLVEATFYPPRSAFNGTPSIFRNATRGPLRYSLLRTCNNLLKTLYTISLHIRSSCRTSFYGTWNFLLFIYFCTARFCLTNGTCKLYAHFTFKFIVSGSSTSTHQDLRDTQEKCHKFDMTQNVQKVQSCPESRGGKANASLRRRSAGIFSSGNFIFLLLFAFHCRIVRPVTRATANVRSKIARLVHVRGAMKKQREYVNATSGR